MTLVVRTNAGNSFVPAPEVSVTWSGCGASAVSDEKGEATVSLGVGRTFAPRLGREGLTTTLWPEITVSEAQRLSPLILRGSMGEAYGLRADAPLLWVKVYPGARCKDVEGTTIEVEGRPEAKPEYIGVDGPIDLSLRATSVAGTALVRGLPAGAKVKVRGSKASCTTNTGPWGAVPLERGVISAAPICLE